MKREVIVEMIVTSLFGFYESPFERSRNRYLPLREMKELSKTRIIRFTL